VKPTWEKIEKSISISPLSARFVHEPAQFLTISEQEKYIISDQRACVQDTDRFQYGNRGKAVIACSAEKT
jgi:hypothetical protein